MIASEPGHHSRKRSYRSPKELQNWNRTENLGKIVRYCSGLKLDDWNQTEIWMIISKMNCALCSGYRSLF